MHKYREISGLLWARTIEGINQVTTWIDMEAGHDRYGSRLIANIYPWTTRLEGTAIIGSPVPMRGV